MPFLPGNANFTPTMPLVPPVRDSLRTSGSPTWPETTGALRLATGVISVSLGP